MSSLAYVDCHLVVDGLLEFERPSRLGTSILTSLSSISKIFSPLTSPPRPNQTFQKVDTIAGKTATKYSCIPKILTLLL